MTDILKTFIMSNLLLMLFMSCIFSKSHSVQCLFSKTQLNLAFMEVYLHSFGLVYQANWPRSENLLDHGAGLFFFFLNTCFFVCFRLLLVSSPSLLTSLDPFLIFNPSNKMQLDPALVQPPAFWLLSVSPLLTLLIPPPCSVFLYSRHSGLEAALPRDRGQLWGRGNRMVKMAVWGLSATLGAAVFAVAQTAMDWGPEVLLQLFWCGGGDFRLLYAHIGDSRHTSALQMDLTISNYIKHTYTKMVKTCKSSLLLQHWSQAVGGRLSWCQTGCCYSTTMNICELLVSLRTWVRMCAHTRVCVVVRFWASIPDLIPHVNMDVYLKRSTVIWLTLQKQDLGHWARASVWSDWQQFFLKSQVNQMTTKGCKKTPVMMQKDWKETPNVQREIQNDYKKMQNVDIWHKWDNTTTCKVTVRTEDTEWPHMTT